MFSHIMIGSNGLEKSKTFYDALFIALGGRAGSIDPKGRLLYIHRKNIFMVTTPIDGNPATVANGSTIGFAADTPEQADAWHKAGAAAGGEPIEDEPGWREGPAGKLYLAYLRDPDGNKICALCRG